ncbi:PREDICTED: proline-rich receptor-like protein kinase PERK13, partial [Rhagoletis zephyria]|uniref:proline-rich receptor-like protein kinase PERK13 n=1 Tax=Rhagoletis zephyria TaxID=28612 RepID=UPI000811A858
MEIENEGRERPKKGDKPAPADRWKSGPHKQAHLPAPAEKQKSGPQRQQQHRPAPAEKRKSVEPTGSNKRGSNQVTPPETPGTKRQREQPPPPNSWSRSLGGPIEQGQAQGGSTQQPSYSEALKGIRVAVLP